MRHTQPRELRFYRTSNGRVPFTEWYDTIRDRSVRNRIQRRLDRLEDGNFGDSKSVGEGMFELPFHFGAGYRIYFAEVENTIVLLLCAGDKSSQARDMERAKEYWVSCSSEFSIRTYKNLRYRDTQYQWTAQESQVSKGFLRLGFVSVSHHAQIQGRTPRRSDNTG